MTVDEIRAWVPPDQWGCWELVDGCGGRAGRVELLTGVEGA
jgi:hypothetical protein